MAKAARATAGGSWAAALLLAAACACACAGANGGAGKARGLNLAVLAVEVDLYPELATALNQQLPRARVAGVRGIFRSTVSLEVVQISIECVDPTEACRTAVGKSLAADRLLFADTQRGADGGVEVTITLFDVEQGRTAQVVKAAYADEAAALAAVPELVGRIAGGSPR